MICPYCGSNNLDELIYEHPYPYRRYNKDGTVNQYIEKRKCDCGEHFFYEERIGSEIGGHKNWSYIQVYKQGWYQFGFLGNPL
jgi:hypothetical protein